MQANFRAVSSFLWEVVKVALISLAIILPIRYFLVQPFYVKGASMEPSFYDHDYLLIDEVSYRFRQPQRGEVVVFHYPRDPRQFFIKRIVGLPGERVAISQNKVWVGPAGGELVALNEPYLGVVHTRGDYEATLGPDEFYVLGDNRESSLDSRSFGPINDDSMVGRIWIRGWPFERWSVYSTSLLVP